MADRIGVGDRRVGVTERVDVGDRRVGVTERVDVVIVCCIVLLRHFTQTYLPSYYGTCGVVCWTTPLYRIVLSRSLSHVLTWCG